MVQLDLTPPAECSARWRWTTTGGQHHGLRRYWRTQRKTRCHVASEVGRLKVVRPLETHISETWTAHLPVCVLLCRLSLGVCVPCKLLCVHVDLEPHAMLLGANSHFIVFFGFPQRKITSSSIVHIICLAFGQHTQTTCSRFAIVVLDRDLDVAGSSHGSDASIPARR